MSEHATGLMSRMSPGNILTSPLGKWVRCMCDYPFVCERLRFFLILEIVNSAVRDTILLKDSFQFFQVHVRGGLMVVW